MSSYDNKLDNHVNMLDGPGLELKNFFPGLLILILTENEDINKREK
ncbi:MAG: hypothetical protein GXY51_12215 [Bacteroidetes bacterium]|nr:hypothetical protein [Bacteroidota bacterium]